MQRAKMIRRATIFGMVLFLSVQIFGGLSKGRAIAAKESPQKGKAKLQIMHNYGLHEKGGGDRYSWMDPVRKMYTGMLGNNYDYFSSVNLLDGFEKANYLTIHTHGAGKEKDYSLVCIDKEGASSKLGMSKFSVYSKTKFQNLKLAYVGACRSADKKNNFAKMLCNHGAQTAIGYKESVITKCNYNTIKAFHAAFSKGKDTVATAMQIAIRSTYTKYSEYGDVDSYMICGDSQQIYRK